MDFIDEEKLARAAATMIQPVVLAGIDRLTETLVPALEQAVKDGLDGLTITVTFARKPK